MEVVLNGVLVCLNGDMMEDGRRGDGLGDGRRVC